MSRLGVRFVDAHARYDVGTEIAEGLLGGVGEAGQAVRVPDSLEERPLERVSKMAAPIDFVESIVRSDEEKSVWREKEKVVGFVQHQQHHDNVVSHPELQTVHRWRHLERCVSLFIYMDVVREAQMDYGGFGWFRYDDKFRARTALFSDKE
ncbi:hypothetical protein NDU88_002993 [Pleurodeles waltl]|uniref:Uncharacterized protein n=1 Tax=Pleurodeles waltl TaxID=8319 RepID=A0AAV7RF24_PLEWA|nr:hypothetical protein NDU88_002993 [Pleurodeles waltl]